VLALAAAPDGSWLASASNDRTVQLWAYTSRQLRRGRVLRHTGLVRALAVAPDGSWLACAGDDGAVRLWDPDTGRKLHSLTAHTGLVWALAVAPDGSWLASAGNDGTVRLWDPDTGRELRNLTAHTGRAWGLAVAPDGSWLASASNDRTVRLWDPDTGHELAAVVADFEGWVVLLPDGRYKLRGNPGGVWWASGLCRFDPHEMVDIAEFQPHLTRLDDDVRILG
jgi:WD40 repeat protein